VAGLTVLLEVDFLAGAALGALVCGFLPALFLALLLFGAALFELLLTGDLAFGFCLPDACFFCFAVAIEMGRIVNLKK
jgi:hypothetical protein